MTMFTSVLDTRIQYQPLYEREVNEETHFLFGVSAKHLREDVSTTVSQKHTTGSATLMSAQTQKAMDDVWDALLRV